MGSAMPGRPSLDRDGFPADQCRRVPAAIRSAQVALARRRPSLRVGGARIFSAPDLGSPGPENLGRGCGELLRGHELERRVGAPVFRFDRHQQRRHRAVVEQRRRGQCEHRRGQHLRRFAGDRVVFHPQQHLPGHLGVGHDDHRFGGPRRGGRRSLPRLRLQLHRRGDHGWRLSFAFHHLHRLPRQRHHDLVERRHAAKHDRLCRIPSFLERPRPTQRQHMEGRGRRCARQHHRRRPRQWRDSGQQLLDLRAGFHLG